jgi:hypothetical protein
MAPEAGRVAHGGQPVLPPAPGSSASVEAPGTTEGMTSSHALRAQLDRARYLQASRKPTAAVADTSVTTMPSGIDRVRHRAAERRLPAPHAASHCCSGKLTAGRLKLPATLLADLEFTCETALTISVLGPQLLLSPDLPGESLDGAPACIDKHGRLQLSAGQRQLLGVEAAATVLLLADLETRMVRIVDPARVHALLDELTPAAGAADEPVEVAVADPEPRGFVPRLVVTEGA